MNVLLFDYGTGNLHSLAKALESQGARVRVGADPGDADAVVLPGVGAFGAAAARLAPHAQTLTTAAAAGLPVLGICLGMQLLMDASDEGTGRGFGLIPGKVVRLTARRVPHMGWNTVAPGDEPLFDGIRDQRFYFANSFVAAPDDAATIAATVRHEATVFPAALRRGTVLGTQFHPEKSGAAGLRLLRNFLRGAA